MNIIFTRIALLTALWLAVLTGVARAEEGERPEAEAERLAHILGYTAGDYGGAVQHGAIVSATEYEEQRSLLADAVKIAERLAPQGPDRGPDLVASVGRVRKLVDDKADEAEVAAAVARVRAELVAAFHLEQAPKIAPDPFRGKALFVEHCATCHGVDGHADTERARSLKPQPANFHDPKVSDPLSPARVAGTVKFGIPGTAMVPMTFLSDEDRWALAFYVTGLRHTAKPAVDAPPYPLAELAVRSDAELAADLAGANVTEKYRPGMMAALRRRAPFEAPRQGASLTVARMGLARASAAMDREDRGAARAALVDAYLEGIEPVEAPLRAIEPGLVRSMEERFLAVRAVLDSKQPPSNAAPLLRALVGDITRAELLLAAPRAAKSEIATALSSAGILLREGVEAALLIAALLGMASQAGLADKKRFVHFGWAAAAVLGVATWFGATQVATLSGAGRELIEGVTALLATAVLFYVSHSLLAKREVARWMKFLRAQVTPRRAALSLFGVAFLAAYREAFETVLFYQALLASSTSVRAALLGAAGGAAVLVLIVGAYSRAGKFAPPQVFFRVSSVLLYGLAIVFAGQGVAALQMTGWIPVHAIPVPSVPALGLYPTIETCAAELLLLGLAAFGFLPRAQAEGPPKAATPAPAVAERE